MNTREYLVQQGGNVKMGQPTKNELLEENEALRASLENARDVIEGALGYEDDETLDDEAADDENDD